MFTITQLGTFELTKIYHRLIKVNYLIVLTDISVICIYIGDKS